MAFNNTPTPQHKALLGHTIDKNRLQFVSVLGLGAYGVVYLARDVSASINASVASDPSSPYTGRGYYAVKCLNKTGLDARQKGFQRREIALHTLASSHPNIVSLHRVVETSSVIYVILSFCPDGDLFSMITDKSRYLGDQELIRSVFLQIVDAVAFCHKLGIYHRDLKPENILCDQGGKRVLLADFGLATTDKTSSDFGCGSTFYMSPGVFELHSHVLAHLNVSYSLPLSSECQGGLFERNRPYSSMQNDIWSLGVILVNLTCGRNPWKQACPSDETFKAYLENPDFLPSILPISPECNHLLKRIFCLNPANRISITELRETAFRIQKWTLTEEEALAAQEALAQPSQTCPKQGTSADNSSDDILMHQDSASSSGSSDTNMTTDTSFDTHRAATPSTPESKSRQSQSALQSPHGSQTPGLTTPKARQFKSRTSALNQDSSPTPSSAGSSSSDDWSMPPTPSTPCSQGDHSTYQHQIKRFAPFGPGRVTPQQQQQQAKSNLDESYRQYYANYASWAEEDSPSRNSYTLHSQTSSSPHPGLAPPFQFQTKSPPQSPTSHLRPQHRRQKAFFGSAQ